MKCAPKIWKKFSMKQQAIWLELFERFNTAELLPTGLSLPDDELEVLAHNMACEAVWALKDLKAIK